MNMVKRLRDGGDRFPKIFPRVHSQVLVFLRAPQRTAKQLDLFAQATQAILQKAWSNMDGRAVGEWFEAKWISPYEATNPCFNIQCANQSLYNPINDLLQA